MGGLEICLIAMIGCAAICVCHRIKHQCEDIDFCDITILHYRAKKVGVIVPILEHEKAEDDSEFMFTTLKVSSTGSLIQNANTYAVKTLSSDFISEKQNYDYSFGTTHEECMDIDEYLTRNQSSLLLSPSVFGWQSDESLSEISDIYDTLSSESDAGTSPD